GAGPRRERTTADRHLNGLCAAKGLGSSRLRRRPPRDAFTAHTGWGQGDGGGWDDRRPGGHRERRRRRGPTRGPIHHGAAHPRGRSGPVDRGALRRHSATMTEGLRRGLTNYGDRDFALYLRRSFARSMGYSAEALG